MKKWTYALTTCIMTGLLTLTGCGTADQKARNEVAVTYVTSPLNVPSIVERNHSFFHENMQESGIETVKYSEITSGADQTQALASGDIQFLYAVGATSAILSAANGADIKIISMYSRSPEAFCLFSNDASIKSPEDLRGKTIAGPQGTILHEMLVSYLATANMTLDDVQFMNTSIPDAMAALSGKRVDCALLAGAAAYNTQQSDAHLVTNGKDLVEATIVCATTQKFYDEYPEIVEGFLKGHKATLDYMQTNKADVLQEAAKALDLDISAVEAMYPLYDFDMTMRDSDIAAMQSTMEFMLDSGMIEQEVDIHDLILQ